MSLDETPTGSGTQPDFDEIIDRVGTHSSKWDTMEKAYGVSPEEGLAMWVADMDFRAPQCVQDAVAAAHDHGIYGYYGDERDYRKAVGWWMKNRHGWQIEPGWIFTTHGLVNGTAMCVESFTQPGDGVVLFTPVYHAFARVIKAAGRTVTECELIDNQGHYELDFASYDAKMTGRERMAILCSPHNPGGRVWTRAELQGFADFAKRHDLILISDEIHHDLVYPGNSHMPMSLVDPTITDRLVMMTAMSKTFNLAGVHTGNVIIEDANLRGIFTAKMAAMGMSANSLGLLMATAAYSPEGAVWVDQLIAYLDENRKVFDAGINAISGLNSMQLQSTYLSWVDFSGTGMSREEFTKRVEHDAKIAVNHGSTFGTGGENFLRFNIATPRARIVEAVERLQTAFADLQ